MKFSIRILAGMVLVLAGCGDGEQAAGPGPVEQEVPVESAAMPGTGADPAADAGDPAAETADSMTDDAMTAARSTVDAAAATGEAVSETVAGAAATAATMAGAGTSAGTTGTAPPVEAAPAAAAAADLEAGKAVYTKHCFACHGTGVAGAPKLGDAANWAPRIERGMEAMSANAINGYQGASGYMPPKGGFTDLADEQVTAAVAYMVSESR